MEVNILKGDLVRMLESWSLIIILDILDRLKGREMKLITFKNLPKRKKTMKNSFQNFKYPNKRTTNGAQSLITCKKPPQT